MFSMKNLPSTKTVDPFEGITVSSSSVDTESGARRETVRGVIDAYYCGESSIEQAIGFSINGTYIAFRQPLPVCRAAREVLDALSQYFQVSGVSFRATVEILGSYLELVQHMGGQPVGAVPTSHIVERLEKNYVGQFASKEDFLATLRKACDWMDEERSQSSADFYHESTGNHYFKFP